MANFPIISTSYMGRTNLNLVVSEGNAPAEPFIASADETVKFMHAFGPEGNNNVVIPRGKIVTSAGLEYDIQQEKWRPALKIAGEGDFALGVSMDNAYEARLDRLSVNEVTLITRNYIRVPLFANETRDLAKGYAAAIKYGAAWVENADPGALMGQYVVSDAYGNFRPYVDGTDDPMSIIGQCLAVEKDLPPAGYLQYFIEAMGGDNEFTKLIAATAKNFPSPGRTKATVNDPTKNLSIDTFPFGSYIKDRASLAYVLRNFRAGIPFLTDGYFKARTNKTYALVTSNDADVTDKIAAVKTALDTALTTSVTYSAVKNIRVMGTTELDATPGLFNVVGDHVGSALFVTLPEKLCLTKLATDDALVNHPEMGDKADILIVKVIDPTAVGNAAKTYTVPTSRLHIDYENNIVGIYFTEVIADRYITIEATVLENQVPGIPTGWDFANNMGEARILLMK